MACADEEASLEFDHVLLDAASYGSAGGGRGLAAVGTSFGAAPVCLGGGGGWGDAEADALCGHLGYQCGMLDRGGAPDEPEKLSLLDDNLILGLFSEIQCDKEQQGT